MRSQYKWPIGVVNICNVLMGPQWWSNVSYSKATYDLGLGWSTQKLEPYAMIRFLLQRMLWVSTYVTYGRPKTYQVCHRRRLEPTMTRTQRCLGMNRLDSLEAPGTLLQKWGHTRINSKTPTETYNISQLEFAQSPRIPPCFRICISIISRISKLGWR